MPQDERVNVPGPLGQLMAGAYDDCQEGWHRHAELRRVADLGSGQVREARKADCRAATVRDPQSLNS